MLRISKLTDYAIVIMSYLGLEPNRVASAVHIAKSVHLSPQTVSKLLKILFAANLVTSFRGTGGGYQLAKPAIEINLAQIVSAIEGRPAMTECCMEENDCTLESLCTLKDNWKLINKIILNALAGFTLQDMMQPMALNAMAIKGIPIRVKGF